MVSKQIQPEFRPSTEARVCAFSTQSLSLNQEAQPLRDILPQAWEYEKPQDQHMAHFWYFFFFLMVSNRKYFCVKKTPHILKYNM